VVRGCCGRDTAGVELQVLPRIHVEDVHIVTTRNPDLLTITVSVSNADDRPQEVNISGGFNPGTRASTNIRRCNRLRDIPAHGTVSVSMLHRLALGLKSYWWPNVPYRPGYKAQLHTLSLQLYASGHAIESNATRFGFREFRAVGITTS